MSRAFHELFAVTNAFAAIPMPGRTDHWLVASALAAHGIPHDHPSIARFPATYHRYLEAELKQPPPPGARNGVLPGVQVLLDALAGRRWARLGLLTGNYQIAARMKLARFDLWRYFVGNDSGSSAVGVGAFGDAALDRNLLLAQAIAEVAAHGGPSVAPEDVVVIGDTPFDVAVAKYGGARAEAVATGSHGVEALRASGADIVFEDLADTRAVLDALERNR
jgi:phosphoglycolate phosphatase-like HAD superfamily hydrolase